MTTRDDTATVRRGPAGRLVAAAVEAANTRLPSGALARKNRETILSTGALLQTAHDVDQVVVGTRDGQPIFLRDIAEIVDSGEEPTAYVRFGHGAAAEQAGDSAAPAITLAVAKRKGTNSIAIVSVSLLIWLTIGLREAGVVLLAIPATLALTLTVFYLYGYTLNRITLFALIFSIEILVDDAIVVVENIARHNRMPANRGRPLAEVAIEAVDEVGNPTILATATVIAAILPMAFVDGLMGPYMRPIPVGASAAMVFSLIVAFVVTPWATIRLLRSAHGSADEPGESASTRLYRRIMAALLGRIWLRRTFLGGVVVLLLGSLTLVGIGFVRVKMLPFDNKSEFQVIVDMPEGTTLERTARVTDALPTRSGAKRRWSTTRSMSAPPVRSTSTASFATTSCGAVRTSPTSRRSRARSSSPPPE